MKQGYLWNLKVASEAVPATFQTVGAASDVELEVNGSAIDVSTRTGAGWKNKEAGLRDWKCSVKHLWLPSDAAYILLQAAMLGGTKVLCQFSEATPAAGVKGFDGTAVITKLGVPQPLDGAVFLPIELEGDGALVPATRA